MWRISWLAENRLASEEGLCSMEWVTGFRERNSITPRPKCQEQLCRRWTGKGVRLYSTHLVTSMLPALKMSMTAAVTPCGVLSQYVHSITKQTLCQNGRCTNQYTNQRRREYEAEQAPTWPRRSVCTVKIGESMSDYWDNYSFSATSSSPPTVKTPHGVSHYNTRFYTAKMWERNECH
jgi:hypothetical protein